MTLPAFGKMKSTLNRLKKPYDPLSLRHVSLVVGFFVIALVPATVLYIVNRSPSAKPLADEQQVASSPKLTFQDLEAKNFKSVIYEVAYDEKNGKAEILGATFTSLPAMYEASSSAGAEDKLSLRMKISSDKGKKETWYSWDSQYQKIDIEGRKIVYMVVPIVDDGLLEIGDAKGKKVLEKKQKDLILPKHIKAKDLIR